MCSSYERSSLFQLRILEIHPNSSTKLLLSNFMRSYFRWNPSKLTIDFYQLWSPLKIGPMYPRKLQKHPDIAQPFGNPLFANYEFGIQGCIVPFRKGGVAGSVCSRSVCWFTTLESNDPVGVSKNIGTPKAQGPQNTPKWSFLVGKPMVVGYHHFWKHPMWTHPF